MKEEFSVFIRWRIRYEILWKALRVVLLLSLFFFFWWLSRDNVVAFEYFSLLIFIVVFTVLFIAIPRWKRYYLTQHNYASKFAEALEIKAKDLIYALNHLSVNPLPKEIFWINFKIDPASLKIEFEIHSTVDELPSNLEDFRYKVEALTSVKESTILELRKKGWGADDNIALSLEMVRLWLSYCWNSVQLQKWKGRSTVSIKDRSGHYNMASKKWEDRSFL